MKFNRIRVMKIGIMTFWDSNNNYGQVLQLFALQNYLKKLGHEPFLIKFHRKEKVSMGGRTVLNKLFSRKLISFLKYKMNAGKRKVSAAYDLQRQFPAFKTAHIVYGDVDYYSLGELMENPPPADVYFSGSDQVWNNHFKYSAEPFLLGFGDRSVRRVSYAASLGQTSLNEQDVLLFSKYLDGLDFVSVREEGTISLLSPLTKNTVRRVLDPTLLFVQEEWAELLDLPVRPLKEKAIFIYTLGNSEIKDKAKFIDYAKSISGYEIVHATANDDFSGNAYPTVEDWLQIIGRSALVITTSFHAIVFCIIHQTSFIVLPNSGDALGMNDRMRSLLQIVDLEDHIMDEFDEQQFLRLLHKEIAWDVVNQMLATYRQVSHDFLKIALSFD